MMRWEANALPTVEAWTGRETRALRQALRMSIRDFAENLGVSERTVSKWEAGREAVHPRPEMQAALDTMLGRAGSQVADRFVSTTSRAVPHPSTVSTGYRVQSHKFIPAYVGAAAAGELMAQGGFQPRHHEWLEVAAAGLPHAAGTCTAHVFACGVVVLHIAQDLHFSALAALAAWRYASYENDCPGRPIRLQNFYRLFRPPPTSGPSTCCRCTS
ncbi:helix-turn-helix domain-containing protein [Micromonospora lupini]